MPQTLLPKMLKLTGSLKTYGQMIFDKSGKIIQWGKDSIPQNGAGRTWHPYAKEWDSVQLSHSVMSDSLQPCGLQHARPCCSSPTPGVYSNSCPLSWWCHPSVSSSVDLSSAHLQSFPATGSFQMRQLFTSGGQRIGVSASASVLPPNIQNWLPLDGLVVSPSSPRDSQKSSSTPQFESINYPVLSFLYSPTHIHTWLLEKPQLWLDGPLLAK